MVEAAVAVSPEGALGAVLSADAVVVADEVFEYALRFPAASVARTR